MGEELFPQIDAVSGAGDTFLSALTLSLAAGAPTENAAEIASAAASIVVEKDGTSACHQGELRGYFSSEEKNVTDVFQLVARLAAYRGEGRKIVFTNGCFDILHRGHITYLNRAKAFGDILIVGLNSDDSVRRLKGPSRPINLDTVNLLYGLDLTSFDLQAWFDSVAVQVEQVKTSEDVVISKVGQELYEKFFRNYTRKQWGLDPSELDASVTARVPVRLNRDDRYFGDTHQSMPRYGYTKIFKRILDHPRIKVMLNTSYRDIIDMRSANGSRNGVAIPPPSPTQKKAMSRVYYGSTSPATAAMIRSNAFHGRISLKHLMRTTLHFSTRPKCEMATRAVFSNS